jgi:hypothetical protein
MSRAYRVEWVVVGRNVSTRDEVKMSVSLLGILPEGEMVALLRSELEQAGWTALPDGEMQRDGGKDGVSVRLAADGKTVTLSLKEQREVQARGTDKDSAKQNLESAGQSAEDQMKAQIGRKLAALEPDVRAELDTAVQRVYVGALKQKAASLGRVESVQETTGADGAYEVTIKVKT